MPSTPVTPTLVLCDQLVAALLDAWGPEAPDLAERVYVPRVPDAESDPKPPPGDRQKAGRRVFVFPGEYAKEPNDRERDQWRHRVGVQVFERYTGQGDVPREWIDERVDFVHTHIVQAFDFGPRPPDWNPWLLAESYEVTVYSPDHLIARKLFFSQVEFDFTELRPV